MIFVTIPLYFVSRLWTFFVPTAPQVLTIMSTPAGYNPVNSTSPDDQMWDNNSQDEPTIPEATPAQQLFPYAIVWGPLPLITQLCPFIGHLGIADSRGRIHDFHGPYYVGIDNFMVGDVYKYVSNFFTPLFCFNVATPIRGYRLLFFLILCFTTSDFVYVACFFFPSGITKFPLTRSFAEILILERAVLRRNGIMLSLVLIENTVLRFIIL